eukprot:5844285-Amphidinium_carterae.1
MMWRKGMQSMTTFGTCPSSLLVKLQCPCSFGLSSPCKRRALNPTMLAMDGQKQGQVWTAWNMVSLTCATLTWILATV